MEPEAAADALAILREGERRVRRVARREQALTLGVGAVTTVLWMGRKDIREPVRRRVVGAGSMLGAVGLGLWQLDRSRVGTLWSERTLQQRPDLPAGETERRDPSSSAPRPPWGTVFSALTPKGKRRLVVGVLTMLAQPLVGVGFRRSRIRYPNLAAGVVTAAMSLAVGLTGMRSRPEADDD
jgi:hypothetical protein